MNRRLTAVIGVCVIAVGAIAYFAIGAGNGASTNAQADTAATRSSDAASTSPAGPATVSPTSAPLSAPPSTATAPSATRATRSPSPTTTPRTPVPSTASTSSTNATSAALAGRIRPGASYSGVATAYDSGNGTGSCLFDPTDDPLIAAMNVTDYETAKACGASILIHASNGKSITVHIVNDCPAPCAPGQIDLSQAAFAKLADLKVGRLPITWTLVSPATADPLSIRYKTGSSRWWCGIQVIGHRNPVASLEVRVGGAWRGLARTDYNYFISGDGSGCGGQIRVTDIYGQQLVIDGIAVTPNVAQRTTVQFAKH